jgi:hypothetical protein
MLLGETGPPVILLWCTVALMALSFLVMFVVVRWVFSPWMRALLSATPVSVFDILGMRFRRTDVNAVLKSLVLARQAGVALSCHQLERAYLQGVDLEKLTLAMIHAKKEGMEVTFEELVESDLEGRLAEKLNRPVPSGSGMRAAQADRPMAADTEHRRVRICGKCSKEVSGDGKICRNCGAIL